MLLTCEGAPTPYWGPKHFLTDYLGLTLNKEASPAFVHFWKPGDTTANDQLLSYPVYNLGHTQGNPKTIERHHLHNQNSETTDLEIARHVRSLIQFMPKAPNLSFSPHNTHPCYDLHSDTLHLGPETIHYTTPNYLYRLLTALIHATAHDSRRQRPPHPPLRELFVTSLAASHLTRHCGFRRPPRATLPSKYVFYNYVHTAYAELFHAARDVHQAIDTILGWEDRQEQLVANYLYEYNLA